MLIYYSIGKAIAFYFMGVMWLLEMLGKNLFVSYIRLQKQILGHRQQKQAMQL